MPDFVHADLYVYASRLEMQTRSRPHLFPEWMRGKRLSAGDVIRYLIESKRHQRKRRNGRRKISAVMPDASPVQCPDDTSLGG